MSYSRWKDDRFFPAFRDAFMAQHTQIDEAGLNKAREYNAQRYYYQGIGRYTPDQAYARGLSDLQVLADLIRAGRLCARREAVEHRCRHLRLHRQHPLLPDPDAAEGVRLRSSQPGAALRGHSRGGQSIPRDAAFAFWERVFTFCVDDQPQGATPRVSRRGPALRHACVDALNACAHT